MFDVITIGSATRDVFLRTDNFESRKHLDSETGVEQCLPLGSKVEIKKVVFTTGGGGTNAAVTFARQGHKVACVGVIGDDSIGEEIVKELKREKVDTEYMARHSDDITAYSTILVNASGERTILSYKGEGQHFDLGKVPVNKLEAKWLYIDSLGGHYDLFQALVERAAGRGIKIASNPGGKELAHGLEKLKPLLAKMDVYITNKEEGEELVGKQPSTADVAKELKKYVKGIVSVSDGHNGVTVYDGEKLYSAGVPDSPIVERTGAGDAFGSGFVCEYMRSGDPVKSPGGDHGASIVKAIQFATANASSVVTQFGAKAGILRQGDWGPWPLVEVRVS